VGHLAPGFVEVEHLDARLRRVEHPVVLVGAGHLALHAAGALGGIEVQGSHHGVLAPMAFLLPLSRTSPICRPPPHCWRGGRASGGISQLDPRGSRMHAPQGLWRMGHDITAYMVIMPNAGRGRKPKMVAERWATPAPGRGLLQTEPSSGSRILGGAASAFMAFSKARRSR